MRACVIHRVGGPEVLSLEKNFPVPRKAGAVLVKTVSVGVVSARGEQQQLAQGAPRRGAFAPAPTLCPPLPCPPRTPSTSSSGGPRALPARRQSGRGGAQIRWADQRAGAPPLFLASRSGVYAPTSFPKVWCAPHAPCRRRAPQLAPRATSPRGPAPPRSQLPIPGPLLPTSLPPAGPGRRRGGRGGGARRGRQGGGGAAVEVRGARRRQQQAHRRRRFSPSPVAQGS